MYKISIFDTAESSRNIGDQIINEAIEYEMNFLFKNNYINRYATHTPIINFYQTNKDNPNIKFSRESKYKFIEGTNLISTNLLKRYTTWNLNFYNYIPYIGSILIGCGLNPNSRKTNFYTKKIYKKILSKDYIHSVRDNKTKAFIEKLGLKAINTGCPTLWMFNKEFCKQIPKEKANKVIFTLTDYCRDAERDTEMIKILEKNYSKIYFWIQGADDLEYFNSLNINKNKNIEIIPPSLNEYRKILDKEDLDYVGTRLHAGIYAMRYKKRSIIIIIDNRARDMNETNNLVAIERNEINSKLDNLINSRIDTDINIDIELINNWKSQFK